MSKIYKNKELINLLLEVIDVEKFYSLITTLSKKNCEGEIRKDQTMTLIPTPKKLTPLQKKQNMRSIIEKKFRQKYKS
jgi:hypothetical protein